MSKHQVTAIKTLLCAISIPSALMAGELELPLAKELFDACLESAYVYGEQEEEPAISYCSKTLAIMDRDVRNCLAKYWHEGVANFAESSSACELTNRTPINLQQ